VLSRSFQRSRRLSSTVSLLTAAHAPYAKARSWSNKGMPQFRSSWCFPVNWRRCVLHARLKHSSGWEFVAKRPDLDLARTLAENSPAGTVAGQPTRPDRRSGPQSEGWFGPILLACSSKARVQLVRTSDRRTQSANPSRLLGERRAGATLPTVLARQSPLRESSPLACITTRLPQLRTLDVH